MMKKLLFIVLGFGSLNAFAVNPTQGPLQQNPALCSYGYNPNCNQGNNNPPKKINTTVIHVPSKYGALAFNSKKGAIGGALNKNSKADAQYEAIKQCEKNGLYAPCKVIATVRNGCIAAATGKSPSGINKIFRAIEEPGLAEKVALKQCNDSGYSSCQVIMPEGCSVPEGMYN